jgi:8-oxo-dGTP pyrophosphatase MutT (NUDIX family)
MKPKTTKATPVTKAKKKSNKAFTQLSSHIVYQNPWIKIREHSLEFANGKKGIYGVLEKAPGTCIIPLADNGDIYLIKEFRYPVSKSFIEVPGGQLDERHPLSAAKRELFEETGIKAKHWKKLGRFYISPGLETTYSDVYVATGLDLSAIDLKNQEHSEHIVSLNKIKLSDVRKMVAENKIKDGITLSSLNFLFSYLDHQPKAKK